MGSNTLGSLKNVLWLYWWLYWLYWVSRAFINGSIASFTADSRD